MIESLRRVLGVGCQCLIAELLSSLEEENMYSFERKEDGDCGVDILRTDFVI